MSGSDGDMCEGQGDDGIAATVRGVHHVCVPLDEDGQRLDRWLKKQGFSFAVAQKIVRTGQVRVDGRRAKPDQKILAGQDIRLPPRDVAGASGPDSQGMRISPQDESLIRSLVLYDDGDVMALNKPSGLSTQGGPRIVRHVDGLVSVFADDNGVKPRLVHRLDRETSGLLLLARSAQTARALGKSFQGREVRKTYLAITVPAPVQNEGTITAPLLKRTGDHKVRVDEEAGRPAVTDFVVLERAGKKAALVAFQPRTGRMHQIRVHAALIGAPLLGDDRYGGVSTLEGLETARRLHLHARRIRLPHPCGRGTLDLVAPVPADMTQSLCALGFEHAISGDPF